MENKEMILKKRNYLIIVRPRSETMDYINKLNFNFKLITQYQYLSIVNIVNFSKPLEVSTGNV